MLTGRGRGKIRPPRRTLNNPGEEVDVEELWGVLGSALREIHSKNASQLSFEELYRAAYKLVLTKKGKLLYERVKALEESWLSEEVQAKIKDLLAGSPLAGAGGTVGTSGTEKRMAGEKFLKGIRQAWEDHNVCINMITDVLMYMDRVYCTDSRLPSIFTASMGLFRNFVLRAPLDPKNPGSVKVGSLLNSIILDQIQRERQGDIIDRHLIRSCIYMLEGLYETDVEDENEKLYLTSFEPAFLEASRNFYRAEAQRLVRESDAPRFLLHIKERFFEEANRCRSTISILTAPKIEDVIENEVLRGYIQDVVDMEGSGARHMFDNDRYHELQLLYELVGRVDNKKEALSYALYRRIVELGTGINDASKAATSAGGGERADVDATPKTPGQSAPAQSASSIQTTAALKWVDEILQLKDKYEQIWKQAFGRDHELQAAMTRALSTVINDFPRSPEFMSLFIDDNLRRGLKGKTETEADVVLDKAVTLLRYVRDKDMFERYYKKHLSKRLLGGRSVSSDVERQMISKMKLEIGNHFTQKLEGMFKDMTVSEELTTDFRAHRARVATDDDQRVDLGINVLTSTFWPMEVLGGGGSSSTSNTHYEERERRESEAAGTCNFPPEIERVKRSFEQFYLGKHNGRRLTWQANAGSADIKAIFPSVADSKDPALGKERRHELNVSTYAMVILLLFNDLPSGTRLSFQELQAKTMIPSGDLVRNLQSLAVAPKTRVLIKEPMSKDVKPTDQFCVNESFNSKFLKIKVGVVAGANRIEGDKERKDTEKKNDEMRGGIIEAAVVRIMKGRQQLSHQSLCTEVISQLSHRFMPDLAMLKKRIESLIDREYIERIEGGERATYRYVA